MKRRRLCSLLLAGSLIITSLSSSYSTTAAEEFSTDSIVQEDNTEITTEDIPADVQLVTEVDNTTEQTINETTSSEEIIEDSSSEEVLGDHSSEDISTEEITSEITEEDTSNSEEITDNSTEEVTEDESTEDITEDESTEESTEKSVLSPSFTEKVAGVSTTGLDFSSKELLVGTEDPTIFTCDTNVISEYNDVYLIRFEDVETTEIAYTYYFTKADFVSPNITFTVADNDYVNDDSNQDENVADLSNLNQGDDALSIINDLDSIKTPNKTIALIDTGVNADDLVGSISVIKDETSDDNGHGTAMYNYIKEENPNAKILSIKALDKDGFGTADSIYAAIQYAIESKVDIINLSLSANSTEENNIVVQAIKDAIDKDIIVVGSAGNTSSNAKYFIPGCIDEAIIVGACDNCGYRISNSNFGKTVDYNVIANSTSEATARMSGIISSNSGKSSIIYKALVDEHSDDILNYKYENNSFVINNNPVSGPSGNYPYVKRIKRDNNTVIFRQYNSDGTVTLNSPTVTVANETTNAICVNFEWQPGLDNYAFDVTPTTITDANTKQLLYNIVMAINAGDITYGDGHRLMCYALGNDKVTPSNISEYARHGGKNSTTSGFSSNVPNASNLIATYLDANHKIPSNVTFTVQYLTNQCTSDNGPYQNFISWDINVDEGKFYWIALGKVDNDTRTKGLNNATFAIEINGTQVGTVKSGFYGGRTSNGAWLQKYPSTASYYITPLTGVALVYLGKYESKPSIKAKETVAPPNYKLNNSNWFTIPNSMIYVSDTEDITASNVNGIMTSALTESNAWKNDKDDETVYFYIPMYKKSADSNNTPSMNNIRYTLYYTSGGTTTAVATYTLDKDGKVKSVKHLVNTWGSSSSPYTWVEDNYEWNGTYYARFKWTGSYNASKYAPLDTSFWISESYTNGNYKYNGYYTQASAETTNLVRRTTGETTQYYYVDWPTEEEEPHYGIYTHASDGEWYMYGYPRLTPKDPGRGNMEAFTNTPWPPYYIAVKKTDSDGNLLQNVPFRIWYTKDNTTKTQVEYTGNGLNGTTNGYAIFKIPASEHFSDSSKVRVKEIWGETSSSVSGITDTRNYNTAAKLYVNGTYKTVYPNDFISTNWEASGTQSLYLTEASAISHANTLTSATNTYKKNVTLIKNSASNTVYPSMDGIEYYLMSSNGVQVATFTLDRWGFCKNITIRNSGGTNLTSYFDIVDVAAVYDTTVYRQKVLQSKSTNGNAYLTGSYFIEREDNPNNYNYDIHTNHIDTIVFNDIELNKSDTATSYTVNATGSSYYRIDGTAITEDTDIPYMYTTLKKKSSTSSQLSMEGIVYGLYKTGDVPSEEDKLIYKLTLTSDGYIKNCSHESDSSFAAAPTKYIDSSNVSHDTYIIQNDNQEFINNLDKYYYKEISTNNNYILNTTKIPVKAFPAGNNSGTNYISWTKTNNIWNATINKISYSLIFTEATDTPMRYTTLVKKSDSDTFNPSLNGLIYDLKKADSTTIAKFIFDEYGYCKTIQIQPGFTDDFEIVPMAWRAGYNYKQLVLRAITVNGYNALTNAYYLEQATQPNNENNYLIDTEHYLAKDFAPLTSNTAIKFSGNVPTASTETTTFYIDGNTVNNVTDTPYLYTTLKKESTISENQPSMDGIVYGFYKQGTSNPLFTLTLDADGYIRNYTHPLDNTLAAVPAKINGHDTIIICDKAGAFDDNGETSNKYYYKEISSNDNYLLNNETINANIFANETNDDILNISSWEASTTTATLNPDRYQSISTTAQDSPNTDSINITIKKSSLNTTSPILSMYGITYGLYFVDSGKTDANKILVGTYTLTHNGTVNSINIPASNFIGTTLSGGSPIVTTKKSGKYISITFNDGRNLTDDSNGYFLMQEIETNNFYVKNENISKILPESLVSPCSITISSTENIVINDNHYGDALTDNQLMPYFAVVKKTANINNSTTKVVNDLPFIYSVEYDGIKTTSEVSGNVNSPTSGMWTGYILNNTTNGYQSIKTYDSSYARITNTVPFTYTYIDKNTNIVKELKNTSGNTVRVNITRQDGIAIIYLGLYEEAPIIRVREGWGTTSPVKIDGVNYNILTTLHPERVDKTTTSNVTVTNIYATDYITSNNTYNLTAANKYSDAKSSAVTVNNPKDETPVQVFVEKKSGENNSSDTYVQTHNYNTSSITNGLNPNYSLAGATYDIYNSDNVKLGSVVCGADGISNTLDISEDFRKDNPQKNPKQYYAIERISGKNYALNTTPTVPVTVTVANDANNPAKISTYDDITTDPLVINVEKRSDLSGDPISPETTLNAQYRISYYPAEVNSNHYYTAAELKASGIIPETAIITLSKNGTKYEASTNDITDHSMGYIIIEEIVAPHGYNIEGSTYTITLSNDSTVTLNQNEIPVFILDRVNSSDPNADIKAYLLRNGQRLELRADQSTGMISIISKDKSEESYDSELLSSTTGTQVGYINGSTSTTDSVIETFGITGVPKDNTLTYKAKLIDKNTNTQVVTSNGVATDGNKVVKTYTSTGVARQTFTIDFGTFTPIAGHTYASVVEVYGKNDNGTLVLKATHNSNLDIASQEVYYGTLSTNLLSSNNNTEVGSFIQNETLVDTITYSNFPKGSVLKFEGDLYDITDPSNPVKITTTSEYANVTISNAKHLVEDTVSLTFNYDARAYAGRTITAKVRVSVKGSDTSYIPIIQHNILGNDISETVYYPTISSRLVVSSTGTKLGITKAIDSAVETAYFTNVPKDVRITFTGELYDVTTGTPVLVSTSSGSKLSTGLTQQSVALPAFTYDSRELAGHKLSAKLTARVNNVVVGIHNADYTVEDETIYYPSTSTTLLTNNKKYGTPKTSDSAIETVAFTNYPANTVLSFHATLYDVTAGQVIATNNDVSKTSSGVTRQTVTIPFSYDSTGLAGHKLSAKVEVYVGTTLVDTHNASYNVEDETIYYPNPRTVAVSNTTGTQVGLVGTDRIKETIYFNGYKIGDTVEYYARLVDVTDNLIIQTTSRTSVTITSANQSVDVLFNNFTATAGHTYSAAVRIYTDNNTYISHNESYNIVDETVYYPSLSTLISKKVGTISTTESVSDTVTYSNFPEGTVITFNADLVDTNTNTVVATNNTVTATSTGLAAKTAIIPFMYDSTGLAGHKLSVRVTAKVSGKNVVSHNTALNAEDETIYYPKTSTVLLTNGSKLGVPKTADSAIETVSFTNYPAGTEITFNATLKDLDGTGLFTNTATVTSTGLSLQTKDITFNYNSSTFSGHKLSAKVEVVVGGIVVDTHNASYNIEDETIYYQTISTNAVSNTTGGKTGVVGSDRIKDTITFNGYPAGTSITFVSTLRDITSNANIQTKTTSDVISTGLETQTQDVLFDTFTPEANHKYAVKTIVKVAGTNDLVHNEDYTDANEIVYYPILSTQISKKVGTISANETVSDTVTFTNFPSGTTITFKADLVDVNTNTVIASKNNVKATSTGLSAQDATISFTYDSRNLRGHKLSVRVTAVVSGKDVVSHNIALNTENETIYYPLTSTVLLTNRSKFGIPKPNDTAVETVTFTNYPAGTVITFNATLKDITGSGSTTATKTVTSTGLNAQTTDLTFNYNSSNRGGHTLSAKVEVFVNDTLVDTHNGSYDVEDETIYYQTMNTVAVSNTTNGKIGTVGSDRIKDTITFNGYPTDTSIVFVSTLRDVTASTDVQTINTTVTSTGIATQTQDVLFDVFTPVAGHTYSVKTVAKVTGYEDMVHNGNYNIVSETVYYPELTSLISKKVGTISTTESVSDTVTFSNFPEGTNITFNATLVDVTADQVIATNNTVTATSTGLTAQTVNIPFTYNSTGLAGHKLSVQIVAFVSGEDVVSHNTSLNVEDETLYYPITSTVLLTNGKKFGQPKTGDSAVETVSFTNYPAGTSITFRSTIKDLNNNNTQTRTATVTSEGLQTQTKDITFTYNSTNRGGHKLSAMVEVLVGGVVVDTHNADYTVEDETIYYPTISSVAVTNSMNGKIGVVGTDKVKETITFAGYPEGIDIVFETILRDITTGTNVETINKPVTSTGIASQTTDVVFSNFNAIAGHTYSVKVTSKVTGFDDLVHNGNYNVVEETVYYPNLTTLISKKVGILSATESISDTVTFNNVPAGTNLTFNADLVDVATGDVIASNNTVTATSTGLTAQNVNIPFTYDSRNLAGNTLSVRVTAKVSGTNVVSHNIELNTENETIYYPTFATDLLSASTSNKLGSQKTNETARETVTFSNVPAGTVLTVVGELYDVTSTTTPIDTITGTITSSGTQEQTIAITDLFEFDSTLLENTTLAAKLIVKIGDNVIATHNDDLSDVREKIYYMSTDTELLSTYGTHYYKAGKVTASENSRETIKIKNVPVGTILTYTATLADVSDHNAPIKVVNGTYTSTTLGEQTIYVNFTNYDARGLAGHTLSAKVEFNIGNNLVGSHNTDYSDLKETIYYPTGHTTAADKDTTTKLASDSTTATIYDDFYFENLAKGVTYTITGVVHKRNNSTGADDGVLTYKDGSTTKEVSKTITLEVKADGTIVAPNAESYEITSSTDGAVTGKVRLAFTFDASLLEGITTTVFETVSVDNITVFTHSNINDNDQQIHFMKLYTLLKSNSTNKSIGAIVANETATDVLYFEKVPFGSSILFNGTLKYKDTQSDFTTANVTLNVSNTGVATSSSGIATDVTYVVDNATKTVTGTIKLVYSYNSTGLKNKTLVSFVTAKQNNVVVALHEDINDTDETVYYPDIHTNAKDANTMSNVSKLGTTQIIDTVTLNNLVVGNTYVVTGTVNVKNADGSYGGIATKKVNNVDTQITKSVTITISNTGRITLGNGITNSTLTVTGKTVNGTIDITFNVDNTNYLGKDFVVYENLYTDNILLVAHNDLTDVLQTIHNPSGSTQAMDSQTQDEVGTVVENGTITLVDTISLNNLPVGKTYRVDGIIKDKATGENVKNGNSDITSSVTFTVNANGTITAVSPATIISQVTSFDNTNGTINGSVQMNFTLPSSTLANKDVVVFESGYVVVSNTSSVLVFEEKELSELTQTVHFPDITSIATDDTYQKHVGIVSERNAITEKATLYNLVYGRTYTFKASLMDQITGENLKKNNANIEKTITVTVSTTGVVTAIDEANQTITVTTTKYDTDKTVDTELSIPFVYDSTSISGKAMVVFGELSHNNIVVKTHNDIDNTLQQIHYYRLDVKKKNLTDASHAIFNVKHNNELVKFVKISDGVYNIVIGNVSGSVTEISPLRSADPDEDGKLIINGFEDGTYVFTEIKTENDKSLLEDAFSVIFDPTSAEHGKLKDLRVSTSDKSATLTSTDTTMPNVMAIDIINNDIVQLEAGGSGTTIYYIIGGIILLIALLLLGFFIYKKKKDSKDNKTE